MCQDKTATSSKKYLDVVPKERMSESEVLENLLDGLPKVSQRPKDEGEDRWRTSLRLDADLQKPVKILLAQTGMSFTDLMNSLCRHAITSPESMLQINEIRSRINPDYLDGFLSIQAALDSITTEAEREFTLRDVVDLAQFSAKMHRERRERS